MSINHDTISVPVEINGNLVSLVFKFVSNVPFTQIDLPQGRQSGLMHSLKILENVKGIGILCKYIEGLFPV